MTPSSASSTKEIALRVIQPHERQEVLDFLHLHYYLEEPLTAGSEPKQPDKEDEEFNMSNIVHGTCVMAIEKNKAHPAGRIIGVLLSGPKECDEAKHLFEDAAKLGATKWGRTLHFLACIEQEANIFERFNVQRVLHIHVMGVNATMRGRNIGRRLVEEVLKIAKSLHYEMVSADCTSFYSAKLFERMNADCINIKFYKDYTDEAGRQVFKPDWPHECVKTFAFKL